MTFNSDTCGTNSTSYVSVDDALDYLMGNDETFASLDKQGKERALMIATRKIEALSLNASKLFEYQSLRFPSEYTIIEEAFTAATDTEVGLEYDIVKYDSLTCFSVDYNASTIVTEYIEGTDYTVDYNTPSITPSVSLNGLSIMIRYQAAIVPDAVVAAVVEQAVAESIDTEEFLLPHNDIIASGIEELNVDGIKVKYRGNSIPSVSPWDNLCGEAIQHLTQYRFVRPTSVIV